MAVFFHSLSVWVLGTPHATYSYVSLVNSSPLQIRALQFIKKFYQIWFQYSPPGTFKYAYQNGRFLIGQNKNMTFNSNSLLFWFKYLVKMLKVFKKSSCIINIIFSLQMLFFSMLSETAWSVLSVYCWQSLRKYHNQTHIPNSEKKILWINSEIL